VFAVTVTVRAAVSGAAPVKVSGFEPANVKLPAQLCAFPNVNGAEASKVPPVIVSVPLPTAAALPKVRVPKASVVPPVKVFAPASVSPPAPCFVRANAPLIAPPAVSVFAVTVTVSAAVSATAPLRLSAFEPAKV
jgi:hypothetical protein